MSAACSDCDARMSGWTVWTPRRRASPTLQLSLRGEARGQTRRRGRRGGEGGEGGEAARHKAQRQGCAQGCAPEWLAAPPSGANPPQIHGVDQLVLAHVEGADIELPAAPTTSLGREECEAPLASACRGCILGRRDALDDVQTVQVVRRHGLRTQRDSNAASGR